MKLRDGGIIILVVCVLFALGIGLSSTVVFHDSDDKPIEDLPLRKDITGKDRELSSKRSKEKSKDIKSSPHRFDPSSCRYRC